MGSQGLVWGVGGAAKPTDSQRALVKPSIASSFPLCESIGFLHSWEGGYLLGFKRVFMEE